MPRYTSSLDFEFYLVDICQRFIILDQHLRECDSMLRVDAHYIAEKVDVIGGECDLLGIQHDLAELTRLGEALNYLNHDKYL